MTITEGPQLALWEAGTAPLDLAALKDHFRAHGASDWADNPTLTQSASRRLAIVRPMDDHGWLLIAPGAARYLYPVSRCRTRRQALALCTAIESAIDLPWDQPGTEQQLATWRSPDSEDLWAKIVSLRSENPALDSDGLFADAAALRERLPATRTESTADTSKANNTCTEELPAPAPAPAASPFSRSWGHFMDPADTAGPRPPTPREGTARREVYLQLCAGCSDEFVTAYPRRGGGYSFCTQCAGNRRARFHPTEGARVRLLGEAFPAVYLIQSISGDEVKLRQLGFPDEAPSPSPGDSSTPSRADRTRPSKHEPAA